MNAYDYATTLKRPCQKLLDKNNQECKLHHKHRTCKDCKYYRGSRIKAWGYKMIGKIRRWFR